MHKNPTKCNKTQSKWCKNNHGASKIIDTFETYQGVEVMMGAPSLASGTFLLDANLMEVPSGLIKSHLNVPALLVHREYQQ
jgi:hypothetical protein